LQAKKILSLRPDEGRLRSIAEEYDWSKISLRYEAALKRAL